MVVEEVDSRVQLVRVYNFSVANAHNYGGDGVLVHNAEETVVLYHGNLTKIEGGKFDFNKAVVSKRQFTPKPGIYLTDDFLRAATQYGRGSEVARTEVPKSFADSVCQLGGPGKKKKNKKLEYFVDTPESVEILNQNLRNLPTNDATTAWMKGKF